MTRIEKEIEDAHGKIDRLLTTAFNKVRLKDVMKCVFSNEAMPLTLHSMLHPFIVPDADLLTTADIFQNQAYKDIKAGLDAQGIEVGVAEATPSQWLRKEDGGVQRVPARIALSFTSKPA